MLCEPNAKLVGTVKVADVAVAPAAETDVPPIVHVAPVKFVPVIVTLAPRAALVGLAAAVGASPTFKFTLDVVPAGLVTVTATTPDAAPAGTAAVIVVLFTTVSTA